MILLPVFLMLNLTASAAENPCLDWMLKQGVFPEQKDCIVECSALLTDMGTFGCPAQCQQLCKKEPPPPFNKFAFKTTGFTAREISLAVQNPRTMKTALTIAERSSQRTIRIFGYNGRNDESDAFRHFIWAGELTKTLGVKMAREILEAHEDNPDQPLREKQMDRENNFSGLRTAQKMIKTNNYSAANMEKMALEMLKKKTLITIRSSGPVPNWRK